MGICLYPTANHTIAVDAANPFVPMGTKVVMNGVEYVVEDTGNFAQYGVQFDVYYGDHASASSHGHQTWEAYIADSNGSQEVEVTSTREVNRLDVSVTNHNLDAVLRSRLDENEEKRYDLYNTTFGNRNYLFDTNTLPGGGAGGFGYDIPAEALSDRKFANMIHEAEKYLGYPYVWGGASPSTSFDCSGFVSWVINNCGNGWNVGRQTADGLRGCCSYVSPSQAKPGDLIFFQGTYNTPGASHVGIYVGNNMMIHCGNPIQYTIGQREHFYSPLYDRGEIEDVFSIHTDGEDIWDRMPQSELEKLERLLAGEAEAFPIEERIAKTGSIHDLKEIDYYMMDIERTAMTEVQRKRIWDGLDRKGTAILQKAIDNARNGEGIQSVRELLTEAQGILYEEQYAKLNEAVRKRETELIAPEKLPPISDMTELEKSLNGQSRAEIEEMVLCYAQAQIDGMGLTDEVKLLGACVYGSRTREGLYQEGSDVDVVVSYTGNIREDDFFNVLHEDGMEIAGLSLDIDPISTEKTGTLEEFMKDAEKYLDRKEVQSLTSDIVKFEMDYEQDMDMLEFWDGEAEIEENPIYQVYEIIGNAIERKDTDKFTEHLKQVIESHGAEEPIVKDAADLLGRLTGSVTIVLPDPKISFYVAECMEFPVLGDYYDNLTLEEAVKKYEEIPADRINGIKGIGFRLEDGSIYDGDYELMSGGEILRETINLVPHYKESPLVRKAIADLEKIFSEKKEQETAMEAEKQQMKQPGKPSIAKDRAGMEAAGEADLKPEKTPEKAPETHSSVSEGTGRKQSVLQALRERQAKLKAQEQKETEQKPQRRKKGEQEL